MKVIWSKESLERLIEIEKYIARDSPDRAVRFINKLIDRAEMISDYPYQGRIVPEFSLNEIREVILKGYRIVYRIGEGQIEILTVFEGHQRLKQKDLLKEK